ncbi:MAG: transglycosylase SLT domain-containing protein [Candidatus Omnitrophica bacterium]|nr:transglycosylase SLT domain-containing protein [Candidatus Omnitrophota bacterium]MBU1657398.1 transglycosylase SLT domain-containing protein [Candidatus Omnitrophota bacterium]
MIRSVAVLAWAIGLSQPGMPHETKARYARIVQQECKRADCDPFTLVALVHHESRWRPGAVGDGGRAIGLGQIHYQYYGACRTDPDPIGNPGRDCLRTRQALFDPEYNLRQTMAQIEKWWATCKQKTGRPALMARWISGYGGYSRPPTVWCNQKRDSRGRWRDLPTPKPVQDIIRYRRHLIRLARKRR